MNREIKFRGKRIDNGEWAYGGYGLMPKGDDYVSCIIATEFFEQHEDDEHVVCIEVVEDTIWQYTGLKDMNGKEIYEGDIVKSTWVIDNGADISENVTVVFNDGSFWEGETLLGDSHQSVEIIGNIYEHPHLLNPKP